ncbi:hypothetical protein H8356DRAFT_960725, partial [Neocallimastix lanati (nom. inval.)]
HLINKNSSAYLNDTVRYSHKECSNIIFMDINNTNITNHCENAIKRNKILQIFEKFHFNLIVKYSVNPFPFLNSSPHIYFIFESY